MVGNSKGRLSFFGVLRGFGLRRMLAILRALAKGKPRSTAGDASRIVGLIDPPPRVEGLHLVPPRATFLLVANHFEAPGLWVGWVAAAITDAVAKARAPESRELHWLVTSEWRWFEAAGHWVPNPVTSLLFPRAGRVWGMINTPSRPSDVAGRARALRQILTHLKARPGAGAPEPVGLFPEGEATYALREAKPGTGAFLHRICRLGLPLVPVGTYQEGSVLVVRFGEPFFLGATPSPGEDLDKWARRQVMVAIGRLLPSHLWGAYASALSESEPERSSYHPPA